MKYSKYWINELTNVDIDTEKLSDQLTMAGLEVASIQPVTQEFSGVVVGEVLKVEPHPNADRLSVCQVNIGAVENLNIVCGATNVRPKLKVPVALVGAILPNNFKIKKTKLRGVDSAGMLCSAMELGLAADSSGIYELPNDAPIGIDIRKYLMLDDEVIEVELTPNRGDCLSMIGIAREVAAINRIPTQQVKPQFPEVVSRSDEVFPITIVAKDACPHYCGRIIRGINNRILTPYWLGERLRRSGLHPINLIVDVTNYVMLELGQPLHAFDLTHLDKEITVRYANPGENITLLDERTVELTNKTLVIADAEKSIAIAGVMGGTDTGVSLDASDIFLESAFFIPEKLAGVARDYNLQTDSSYRYERGVDFNLQLQALNRATSLIVEIAGGNPGAVSEVSIKEYLPMVPDITLQRTALENVLGFVIPDKDIIDILLCLGMKPNSIADGWQVTIPSWRFDIKIEEDLVEEVARIYGYQSIPEKEIITGLGVNITSTDILDYTKRNRLYCLMESLGYHEVITYSFIEAKLQELLDPDNPALKLANPISSELSVMRTTLWPGLINAVKYNYQRQQQRARFFEVGLRFLPKKNLADQRLAIAGVAFGDLYPEQWGVRGKEPVDFFDLKNDVTSILKIFVSDSDIEYLPNCHAALHPMRSAQICVAGVPVGYVGELHPLIKQKIDLVKPISVFEIDLYKLISKLEGNFTTFSRFPKVKRDIAITVNKEIPWAQIRQKIVDISGELLQNVILFDVYCNENIGLDKRSMAIHLIFQSIKRTLVDSEVESLVDRIVLGLKQNFSASLRG